MNAKQLDAISRYCESAEKRAFTAPTILCISHSDFDEEDEKVRMFYDVYSDRYFRSTISRVLEAEYHINRNFVLGGIVSVADFYSFLGLSYEDGGDDYVWVMEDDMYWIDFDNSKRDDGVLTIEFAVDPIPTRVAEDLGYC